MRSMTVKSQKTTTVFQTSHCASNITDTKKKDGPPNHTKSIGVSRTLKGEMPWQSHACLLACKHGRGKGWGFRFDQRSSISNRIGQSVEVFFIHTRTKKWKQKNNNNSPQASSTCSSLTHQHVLHFFQQCLAHSLTLTIKQAHSILVPRKFMVVWTHTQHLHPGFIHSPTWHT